MKKVISSVIVVLLSAPVMAQAFVEQWKYTDYNPARFGDGFWHGLLAPWSFIARLFIHNIGMYALHNTGGPYDFGFLMGETLALPIGWIAAIFSTIGHFIH